MNSVDSINQAARSAALAAMQRLSVEPTSLVNFSSRGRLVVIGDNQALEIAPRLNERLQTTVILTEGTEEPGVPLIPLGGRAIVIEGYLGNFTIHLGEQGRPNADTLVTDLILDLGREPLIDRQLTPPGYLFANTDESVLQAAIDELSGLVGTFEKPRYFDYNPDLCAHGRAGKIACSRCIEACPADAITSLAERIEVSPHLCQGGGVCATVCPSGAIRYAYPGPGDTLDRMRTLLSVYRKEGGGEPVLVILAESDEPRPVPAAPSQLPFYVEELASVGMDVWLSALAYGARGVLLVDGGGMPGSSRRAVMEQLGFVREILSPLGYPEESVRLIQVDDLDRCPAVVMPDIAPATYAGMGDKRQILFLAIDHLHAQAGRSRPLANLSAGAPFGTAEVDPKACTLCFSCVGACPGKALQTAGEGMLQLLFVEKNCLQCGMCTRTCPENAIWITPRLLFDPAARKARRKLYEEEPFNCSVCGKPFATRSVIDNMLKRLGGNAMFQDERMRRRLTMCEDCRVIDIVQDQEAMNGGVDGRFRQ